MIALNRDRSASAVTRAFKGTNLRKRTERLVDKFFAVPLGEKLDFNSSDSSRWKPAKKQLKIETHGKCAYCEASTDAVAHGDVEHFRPKSVYWWLAFCYDNYLYSCQICNQSFKSDNFTISGQQLAAPQMPNAIPNSQTDLDALHEMIEIAPREVTDAELKQLWDPEMADLPNPYLEDPEDLFTYEIDEPNREVWVRSRGGDRADRALVASENFLGINREELRRDRYPFARQMLMIKAFVENGLDPTGTSLLEQEVSEKQKSEETYAGMARDLARRWNLPGAMAA